MESVNRQGYQQGVPAYNIDYDRKLPHMIDNQLRQDTRINKEWKKRTKRRNYQRSRVQSLKTQQVQDMPPQVKNMIPQYQQ